MGLRIQNNVEAFNAHRNLSPTSAAARSRWRSCPAATASTAPPTTPPAWRSRERMRAQIGGIAQASATRRTASRWSRRLKARSTRCTRCCSASASCRSSSPTARCSATIRPRSRPRSRSSAEIERIGDSRSSTASRCSARRRDGHDPGRRQHGENVTTTADRPRPAASVATDANATATTPTRRAYAAGCTTSSTLSSTAARSAPPPRSRPRRGVDSTPTATTRTRCEVAPADVGDDRHRDQERLQRALGPRCGAEPPRAPLNNLAIYQENLVASESRIRDVDMARRW